MKPIIAVALIFLILIYPSLSLANEKRGTDLLVQTKAGQIFRGELITVKRYALLLLSKEGADVTVDIRETSRLTIVKKSKFGAGFGYGALAGGGVAALGIAGNIESWDTDGVFAFLILVMGGAVIGGLLGGAVGAASGRDNAIEVNTMTEEEITVLLDDLRSRARIPDYQ